MRHDVHLPWEVLHPGHQVKVHQAERAEQGLRAEVDVQPGHLPLLGPVHEESDQVGGGGVDGLPPRSLADVALKDVVADPVLLGAPFVGGA